MRQCICGPIEDGRTVRVIRFSSSAHRLSIQHIDLAARRGRIESMLYQPAGTPQTAQRPPCTDDLEVDVSAVAFKVIIEMFRVAEGSVLTKPPTTTAPT